MLHPPRSPPRPRAPGPMPSAVQRVGPTPPRRAARQTLPLSAARTPPRPPSRHRFLQKSVPCPVLVNAGFAALATVRVHPLKQETGHQAESRSRGPRRRRAPVSRAFIQHTRRVGDAAGAAPPPPDDGFRPASRSQIREESERALTPGVESLATTELRYARAVIPSVMAAVVLLAALVKGSIGFGFPSLATPLLSLVVDVRTAVVVLILPNIIMDTIQFVRRGAPLTTMRRFITLLGAGAVGTMLGTRLLTLLSPRAATFILGVFVLIFVTLNATGLAPKVPGHW